MSAGNPKTEIPTEEGERPVRICNGIVLPTPAYICRPEDLWPTEMKEAKSEWIEPIRRYLQDFTRPIRTIADEIRCLACDEQVTGHHVGLIDPRFKNKLDYAPEGTYEGRCTNCGYPCRLLHKIYMPNGGPLLVRLVGFPLFYHPDSTARTQ